MTTSFTLIRRGSVWISSLSYESFLDGDKGRKDVIVDRTELEEIETGSWTQLSVKIQLENRDR